MVKQIQINSTIEKMIVEQNISTENKNEIELLSQKIKFCFI